MATFMLLAAVSPLFERCRALNIFSAVMGYVPLICVLFAVLLVAATTIAVVKFCHGAAVARLGPRKENTGNKNPARTASHAS